MLIHGIRGIKFYFFREKLNNAPPPTRYFISRMSYRIHSFQCTPSLFLLYIFYTYTLYTHYIHTTYTLYTHYFSVYIVCM